MAIKLVNEVMHIKHFELCIVHRRCSIGVYYHYHGLYRYQQCCVLGKSMQRIYYNQDLGHHSLSWVTNQGHGFYLYISLSDYGLRNKGVGSKKETINRIIVG